MKTKTTVYRIALSCLLLPALLVATAMTSGCNQGIKSSDADLVILTDEQLQALLADNARTHVLVDVRRPDRFAQGHIPNAINIPVLEIGPRDPRLGAQRVVVYSDGWSPRHDDQLSWAAAKKLLALGYANVYDFRGGLRLWQASGGEVVIPDEHTTVQGEDTQIMEAGIDVNMVAELESAQPAQTRETVEDALETSP